MKNKKKSFYRKKYHSLLLSGTFTMGMVYLMLLCDNIIAGFTIGTDGVAAINLITPLIGIANSVSLCISEGTGILYARAIGEMDRNRANRLYGMGMLATLFLALMMPVFLLLFKDSYLAASGAGEEIIKLAEEYYVLLPFNTAILIVCAYVEQMVYADGDEKLVTKSYIAQLLGNIILSIFLAKMFGIFGIMLGTVIGNVSALLILSTHYFKKSNTLKFVAYFSFRNIWYCLKYSITDGINFLLWGIVDFILISYISRSFGDKYLVVLAVAISLIEFAVIFDGIGMAIQPLMGVYIGEGNHKMIRRLMKDAVKTAIYEGIAATVLLMIFAPQFARLFGIKDPQMTEPAVTAIRIIGAAFVANSLFLLETSYYLYIDHISFAVAATYLKDGMFYAILPVIFSRLFGVNGLWIGFAIAPVMGIIVSMGLLRLRSGKERFPFLLTNMDHEITVYDEVLSPECMARMSEEIQRRLEEHGYHKDVALKAGLFAEEISAAISEKNKGKKILIEYSLLYDENRVRLIIRDSGVIFDITDPNLKISGLGSFVASRLLRSYKQKHYIPTTGYNRNVLTFNKE